MSHREKERERERERENSKAKMAVLANNYTGWECTKLPNSTIKIPIQDQQDGSVGKGVMT